MDFSLVRCRISRGIQWQNARLLASRVSVFGTAHNTVSHYIFVFFIYTVHFVNTCAIIYHIFLMEFSIYNAYIFIMVHNINKIIV